MHVTVFDTPALKKSVPVLSTAPKESLRGSTGGFPVGSGEISLRFMGKKRSPVIGKTHLKHTFEN